MGKGIRYWTPNLNQPDAVDRIYVRDPDKPEPFPYQDEWFKKTYDKTEWAFFWEQGCGKTKPIIDTFSFLYEHGEINCVIIVAPNDVHTQWVREQIPTHMPNRVLERTRFAVYHARKAGTKQHEYDLHNALMDSQSLAIFAFSYDGYMTVAAQKWVAKIQKAKNVFMVLDESHAIQTPSAKRTKAIVRDGTSCKYRRIMSGTPLGNGPFPAYSQIKFLRKDFWLKRNLASYAAFKSYFADIYQHPNGYPIINGYRRLDELYEMLASISTRLTKEEAGLNLPPKTYNKLPFAMTKQQEELYNRVAREFYAVLDDTVIDCQNAVVAMTRLRQILCGYIPTVGEEEPYRLIEQRRTNPRIDAAVSFVENWPHQGIIWACYQHDITQLIEAIGEKKCARYDGFIDQDVAARNLQEFKDGKRAFLVANQAKGAEGQNLVMAKSVLYYSNSFRLIHRQQSEDRCHRIGQHNPVDYTDLYCPETVDEDIIDNLREKKEIAEVILGDKFRRWI